MIDWECKHYNDLSHNELYQILKIRQEVFIIEQNCNYLDADNYDQISQHLMCYDNNELVAYMRIVPPCDLFTIISFGRILVKKQLRGQGLGRSLVQKGIDLSPNGVAICMSAQIYLIKLYQEFGFKVVGDEYLEDDIPHVKMIRNGFYVSQ